MPAFVHNPDSVLPKVGIGILAYNRPVSLDKCLASLFSNLDRSVHVAVHCEVWDARVEEILAKYPVWAIGGERRGVPGANNQLLRTFELCEFVFLVQDDVRFLRPEWLETYLRGLRAVPYLSFFDPHYPEEPSQPKHFKVNYFARRTALVRGGAKLWLCRKSPQGAFQAIHRSCIEQVGLFDEGLGRFGCEHTDYWTRTCNAGMAPRDHFFDVQGSAELLKVDWREPPSLSQEERDEAYQGQREYRQGLYGPHGQGFTRISIKGETSAVRVLRAGPGCSGTRLPESSAAALLGAEHWVYPTRIPVLMAHAVSDDGDDRFSVSPARLLSQLEVMSRHLRFITIGQALAQWRASRSFAPGSAVLTFDDGYRDLLTILPALESLSIRLTAFVPVRWIGRQNRWDRAAFNRRPHLSWDDLRTLVASGHEVGSHGLDHRRLSALGLRSIRREIVDSKELLEQRLGCPVTSIAYPFGGVDERTLALVRESYAAGFVAGHGGELDWGDGPYRVRRIGIANDHDASALLLRVREYMTEAPVGASAWYAPPPAPGTGAK